MRLALSSVLLFVTVLTHAQSPFWDQAVNLIESGKIDDADTLAQSALAANLNNPDALVIAGTVLLYKKMEPRYDDSIFRPNIDGSVPGEPQLAPDAVDAVAALWKRVPGLDPSRAYLWGDLAQMTFRSGDSGRAVEYATQVLADSSATPESLRSAASVFALNLDWAKASQALLKIPGERTALLYQGLNAWRLAKDGWRVPLKAFVDNPGPHPAGAVLAAYLIGPAMRDTEAGFLEAIKAEDGIAALAVRQKYVDRYPNKFQPKHDLARSLSQFGSFSRALVYYLEIDRKAIASTPEEKQSVMFQEAWAQQGAGHRVEAARLWGFLTESRDFYVRSAAEWFLGQEALRQGKPVEAKEHWSNVADEPARSKYAYWANAELKKLK